MNIIGSELRLNSILEGSFINLVNGIQDKLDDSKNQVFLAHFDIPYNEVSSRFIYQQCFIRLLDLSVPFHITCDDSNNPPGEHHMVQIRVHTYR